MTNLERLAHVLHILGMAIGLAGLGKGFRHIPQVPIAEAKPGIIERLLIMMEGGPRVRITYEYLVQKVFEFLELDSAVIIQQF